MNPHRIQPWISLLGVAAAATLVVATHAEAAADAALDVRDPKLAEKMVERYRALDAPAAATCSAKAKKPASAPARRG